MRGKAGLFSRFVPFSPASIDGLTAWWDASDSSTLFDADTGGSSTAADGEVGRVEDKSGASRHLIEPTSANRPVRKAGVQNNLDVLRFDGTNDRMVTSQDFSEFFTASGSTVFVACKATTVSTNAANSSFTAGVNPVVLTENTYGVNGWVMLRSNDTAFSFGYENTATPLRFASLEYVPGSWKVFTTTHDDVNIKIRSNGGSEASTSLFQRQFVSATTLLVGAHHNKTVFFDGDIGEIITYNVALSTADREAVETYLMSKWGIS